jgi:polyhydroxybutyrate depolymerase
MRPRSIALVAGLLAAATAACGSDQQGPTDIATATAAETVGETSTAVETSDPDGTAAVTSPTETTPETLFSETADTSPLGGARPATVTLPNAYDAATAWPLVILLHGYSANGTIQDAYLQFSTTAADVGYIAIVPEGTNGANNAQFWNADPAWCCNFGRSAVDDKAYLNSLIDEASTRYHVDPRRVYFVGHSNGGFMAYRMACDFANRVAAVVSIAGSLPLSAADCAPSEPVSVLQIHGTLDTTIPYAGVPGQYPGANETTQRWATYDACAGTPTAGPDAKDYDSTSLGDETRSETYTTCARSAEVALWTMTGSTHIPVFRVPFTADVFAWLTAHAKAPPVP